MALVASRKRLSHELLQKIQESYQTLNLAGSPISFLEVYNNYVQQQTSPVSDAPQAQEAALDAPRLYNSSTKGQTGSTKGTLHVSPSHRRLQAADPAWQRFPAGTGDCCAPKLLHSAALQGIQPLGLVEFWYGSPPGTNTAAKQGRRQSPPGHADHPPPSRVHKAFYGMCSRCETVLGTMLCNCRLIEVDG